MNFKCPKCATGYELPLESLPKPGEQGDSSKLKCVRCKCVFLMSAGWSSPDEQSQIDKDIYFEFTSPAAHGGADDEPRIMYHLYAAEEEDSAGLVVKETGEWQHGRTLDLSDYEISSFQRAARWKARFAGILAFLAISFILYVAAMNDWSINIDDLGRDVKRAFFLQSEDEVEQDLLLQMTVSLKRGYAIPIKKGLKFGVINGEIQNNSKVDVDHVLLEGRILDATKKIVKTIVVPCGLGIRDGKLRKLGRKQLFSVYENKGKKINCAIPSGYSAKFKVVFDDLPQSFNSTYIFEVHPKAVRLKKLQ